MGKITQERLTELSALPRFNWRDMIRAEGELTEAHVTAMDEYFSKFAVMTDGKCVNCDRVQGGLLSALLGGFTWGIAHGEGHCVCGYPARAIHYDVGPIRRLEAILQYHTATDG